MITIYHNRHFMDYGYPSEIINPADLMGVADIAVNDLEEAFYLSQHLDRDWMSNPEVVNCIGQARSTAVGDVMVWNGKVYVVHHVGFKELDLTLDDLLPNMRGSR